MRSAIPLEDERKSKAAPSSAPEQPRSAPAPTRRLQDQEDGSQEFRPDDLYVDLGGGD
jgi:hypothetical protein